jgi:hypothetical protein
LESAWEFPVPEHFLVEGIQKRSDCIAAKAAGFSWAKCGPIVGFPDLDIRMLACQEPNERGDNGKHLAKTHGHSFRTAIRLADSISCAYPLTHRAGVASPGSRSLIQATRDDMIDCMRMKGWAQR